MPDVQLQHVYWHKVRHCSVLAGSSHSLFLLQTKMRKAYLGFILGFIGIAFSQGKILSLWSFLILSLLEMRNLKGLPSTSFQLFKCWDYKFRNYCRILLFPFYFKVILWDPINTTTLMTYDCNHVNGATDDQAFPWGETPEQRLQFKGGVPQCISKTLWCKVQSMDRLWPARADAFIPSAQSWQPQGNWN